MPDYPDALVEWAGHRTGGVRRLFHERSGRPAGTVIRTPLLAKLEQWVDALAGQDDAAPRTVLLLGGPGNGKTEAVESAIGRLDQRLAMNGELVRQLQARFAPADAQPVPRKAVFDLGSSLRGDPECSLSVVHDASAAEPTRPGVSPAALLVDDLSGVLAAGWHGLYLACVNRGILDEALAVAGSATASPVRELLEAMVRAVGVAPSAPSCWPLAGFPSIAVWPMDVESLLSGVSGVNGSPAEDVITSAIDPTKWPAAGACPAGDSCPFCWSREALSNASQMHALLTVLRQYELSTGKRWTFRDLFSLASYLLASSGTLGQDARSPCEWAAGIVDAQGGLARRGEAARLMGPYLLMASMYQHALFGDWYGRTELRILPALRLLRMDRSDGACAGLVGLHHFLHRPQLRSVPATLALQLGGLGHALDPGLADPNEEVYLDGASKFKLREVDVRFSHSVREGLRFLDGFGSISPLELRVLNGLAAADEALAQPDVRRGRPELASEVQSIARDFSCRLVRRSLGVRCGVTRDSRILADYQQVIDGDRTLLADALRQVTALLNSRDGFSVFLNKTFGEPPPPPSRRAVLVTAAQRVGRHVRNLEGRPRSTMPFLSVGTGDSIHTVPLTYEFYRSLRELQSGLLPASLPRTVTALLDASRARLGGRLVRDEDALADAVIRLGRCDEVVQLELGQFVVRTEVARER